MSVTRVPLQPIARGSLAKLWVGVGVAVVVALLLAWKGLAVIPQSPQAFLSSNADEEGVITTSTGLQYEVLEEGTGPSPGPRDLVLVNYEGRLQDGSVFDSGERIPMDVASVVPGFSEGLQQMKRGGKYRLWIKPELGYGMEDRINPQTGDVGIPGASLLVFDVDLLEFATFEEVQAMQRQMQGEMQPSSPMP